MRLLDEHGRELLDAARASGGSSGRRSRARRSRRRRRRRRAPRGRSGRPRARRRRSRSRARECAPRSSGLLVLGGRRAPGEEDLAVRGEVVGDALPDPVRGADEVPAVALRELVDAERRRDGEVDRLAGLLGERVEMLVRELDQVTSGSVRCAKRRSTGPGRTGPRSPSRWRRPCRSSAARSREVVLFGSSVVSASSPTPSGRALSTTRTSSCAARSIAWLPAINPYYGTSVPHGASRSTSERSRSMFVNRMPRYEILSEDAVATLDGGWRRIVTELGIEFLLPEAVDAFAQAGQEVDGKLVKLDPDFVLEQVAKAPREFDVQARNPEHSIHIGGDHMVVRLGLRAAVRARGRGAPRGDDGRLRELLQALAGLPAARLAGRDDLRAERHAARLAPPGHGLRAADAVGQAVHGLGHLGREREGHDRDGRDPVRRPRGDRSRRRSRSR